MTPTASSLVKAQKKIRILIVDDSAFMRKALSKMLETDPEIEIIGTARNGEEGVEKVLALKPDLVTMDIEMPCMDGLTALRKIMEKEPTPVMMVSSISTEGAQATLEALDLGAVDFIPKQSSFVSLDIIKIREELIGKIKNIARRKSILMTRFRLNRGLRGTTGGKPFGSAVTSPRKILKRRQHPIGIIAIGSSTGGPPALQETISKLPRNLPVGVIVSQHIPAAFTKSLAERLNSMSLVTVREAEDGERLEPGLVLIAPGGQHLTVEKRGSQPHVKISTEPADTLYKPCVDVTMTSVAKSFGSTAMGVILTGMGNNGVVGIQDLKAGGGVVIAQNEETCVVYGMPRAVIEAKLVDHVAPLDAVTDEILSYF